MPTPARSDLAAAAAPYRRLLLRHRRLAVALLAAGAAYAGLRVVAPDPPPSRLAVVASHDLEAGVRLTAADIRTVDVASALMPQRGALSAAAALGRVLAAPMRAGEVVTDLSVFGPTLLAEYAPGTVAAAIRLPDADVAALLRTGDRVDVYAAEAGAGEAASLVAADVGVIAVPEPVDEAVRGAIVVLAATPEQAARLAGAWATAALAIDIRS